MRARSQGIPLVLRARGPEISRRLNSLEAAAYFRLLKQLAGGDVTRLPFWVRKLGPAGPSEGEMWAALQLVGFDVAGLTLDGDRNELLDRLAEPIRSELRATGVSMISDWLVSNERYLLSDPQLREVTEYRIELALQARQAVETAPKRPAPDHCRDLLTALGAAFEPSAATIFAAGLTLLTETAELRQPGDDMMEFGSFTRPGSLVDSVRASGFDIERLTAHALTIRHRNSGLRARIDHYVVDGDVCSHDNGRVTRWHQTFDLEQRSICGVSCWAPSSHERYLTERFGNWQTPTLFYNDDLDSPATTLNDSLEGLLFVFGVAQAAYTKRKPRHDAYAASELLKDRFDLDVTNHLPQAPHPKVLSTPPDTARIGNRPVAIVAGDFGRVDATAVRRWSQAATGDHFLVAAVCESEDDDSMERLTTIKSLVAFDHALLYSSISELQGHIDNLRADLVFLDHGSGISTESITATVVDLSTVPVDAT